MFAKAGYLSEVFVSFQGEGAHVGRRHLFVRLAGCNLRCSYCDTPDSLERTPGYTIYENKGTSRYAANPIAADDVRDLIVGTLARETPIDALALTGGEPLTQSEFICAVLGGDPLPVPVLLETNGVLPRRLSEVLPFVDIVSMDIKPPSNTHEGEFWDAHADFLQLARSKQLYVKVLVDQSTTDQDIERAADLVASIAPTTPMFLQPIVDVTGHPLIDADRLAHVYRTVRQRLDDVRVLPQTHKLLGIR